MEIKWPIVLLPKNVLAFFLKKRHFLSIKKERRFYSNPAHDISRAIR